MGSMAPLTGDLRVSMPNVVETIFYCKIPWSNFSTGLAAGRSKTLVTDIAVMSVAIIALVVDIFLLTKK